MSVELHLFEEVGLLTCFPRKREDSFIYMNAYKDELLKRNVGSVVDVAFESDGDKKSFQRLFASLTACSQGFLAGCRPYIALDACHLKGKSNGVLAAATCIDGNNSIFPIAYSVLESENTSSWTWVS
ncbi:putative transposase, MuDR, plant, MULE transposase domain protein [Tanacetum coccineum]